MAESPAFSTEELLKGGHEISVENPCESNSDETFEAFGDRRAYGGRMELLQRVAVKLNHTTVSALALAREVFSEEKHVSIVRVAQ